MIGRRQIPPLETKDQLLEWADRLVRVLQAGDANVDGAQVTKEQITANQANYLLDPGVLFRLSTDAPRTIHGFAGGTSGRLAGIVNVGANNLVIANQSATAEAANRVITGTGADVTLTAGQTCLIQYDSQTQRWRIIGASAGGGGGGGMDILEDGSSVVSAATALNFVEPGVALVTNAGGGQANVAMGVYLLYVGRPGVIEAVLSTDDDGTLFGSAATGKSLFLASNTVDPATAEIRVGHTLSGQESLTIGQPTLGDFFPFMIFADLNVNPSASAVFGGMLLNGGIAAATTIVGMGGTGSFGAFTQSGDFDNLLHVNGIGVDADGNLAFLPAAASLLLVVDGTPGSGFVPGQIVLICTDRNGESHNRLWIRHDGLTGIGQDLGNPDARLQIQNVETPDVVLLSVQGNVLSGDQTADLQRWEGRIYGEADLAAGPGFNQVGDTQIQMIDSSVFPSTGFVWLQQADNLIGADYLVEFTANNTGTNVLTLAAPLVFQVQFIGMYITTVLSVVDAMGIHIMVSINDPGGGAVATPLAGMIVFDTNLNSFVGWDGTSWVVFGASAPGHIIQENSSSLTQRTKLNFQDGLVATDDAGNDQSDVNVDYATTVASLNTDGSSAVGTAVKVARADHVHTIPSTLDTNARVGVRKNSTGSTSTRRRLNIIEGANITVTVADDSGDEEVDVTVAATGAGGGLTTLLNGRVWAMVCRTYTYNVTTIFALGGHNSPSVIGTTSFVEDTTGAYINHATSTALNAAAGWAWAQTDVRLEVGPDWEYLIKTGANASDIQNTRIWCAFCTAAALDQSDAGVGNVAGFRFSTGAGDTKWQAVTRNAGSGLNTVTDTGVTVAADTRYKLRIDVRNTASINFYINDVLVANISTNLPATTTTGSPYATITNLSAGTARNLRLERMVVEQN